MEELSRRERRKLLREQKKLEKQNQGNDITKILFFSLLALFIVGFGGYKFVKWAMAPVPQVSGAAVEAQEGDWIKGNSEASITLVEYSDFECPACKTYAPIANKLADEYKDKIKLVYRHFPLPQHKNALVAAYAAEAAGKQGKFWEMHDLIFDKQESWSNDSNAKETFAGYAKDLGLNVDQFKSDMDSQSVKDAVSGDITLANSLRINSTPSFILNGQKVDIRGYEDIKSKVDGLLTK